MVATRQRSTLSDTVVPFDLTPGTFRHFVDDRPERGSPTRIAGRGRDRSSWPERPRGSTANEASGLTRKNG